jgi:hypothetical protein
LDYLHIISCIIISEDYFINTLSDEKVLFEHQFWLQILGDHSRFIFYSLTSIETEFILTAQEFIILFDRLLEQSRSQLSASELHEFNRNIYDAVVRLREFKLELLGMSIKSDLKSSLPPSFFNAIAVFTEFLDSIRDQRMDQKVLGILMPLVADHMTREECYYIWKLSETTDNIRRPDCDPTRPRLET